MKFRINAKNNRHRTSRSKPKFMQSFFVIIKQLRQSPKMITRKYWKKLFCNIVVCRSPSGILWKRKATKGLDSFTGCFKEHDSKFHHWFRAYLFRYVNTYFLSFNQDFRQLKRYDETRTTDKNEGCTGYEESDFKCEREWLKR